MKSPEPGGALPERPRAAMEPENDGFVSAGERGVAAARPVVKRGPSPPPCATARPVWQPRVLWDDTRRHCSLLPAGSGAVVPRRRRRPQAPPAPDSLVPLKAMRLMLTHSLTHTLPPCLQPTSSGSSRGRPPSPVPPPPSRRAGRCASRSCWWPATPKSRTRSAPLTSSMRVASRCRGWREHNQQPARPNRGRRRGGRAPPQRWAPLLKKRPPRPPGGMQPWSAQPSRPRRRAAMRQPCRRRRPPSRRRWCCPRQPPSSRWPRSGTRPASHPSCSNSRSPGRQPACLWPAAWPCCRPCRRRKRSPPRRSRARCRACWRPPVPRCRHGPSRRVRSLSRCCCRRQWPRCWPLRRRLQRQQSRTMSGTLWMRPAAAPPRRAAQVGEGLRVCVRGSVPRPHGMVEPAADAFAWRHLYSATALTVHPSACLPAPCSVPGCPGQPPGDPGR